MAIFDRKIGPTALILGVERQTRAQIEAYNVLYSDLRETNQPIYVVISLFVAEVNFEPPKNILKIFFGLT